VTFPPGRARLSTKPAATGSGTRRKTIGIVRVACSNDGRFTPPMDRMTSGASATNSAAYLRLSSGLAPAPRKSMRRLRPSVQPNCCKPCTKMSMSACSSASSAISGIRTPIRRIRSCCARAASGHVATVLPSSDMKSRRL
jgi:hypothetical protein